MNKTNTYAPAAVAPKVLTDGSIVFNIIRNGEETNHAPSSKEAAELICSRINAYLKVLEEFGIDPEDDSYSGGEDAGCYVSGHNIHIDEEKVMERWCVVTQSGGHMYAYADHEDLANAKEQAVMNINDDTFAETPVCIIDLDTGARIEPDWTPVRWVRTKAE